MSMIEQGNWREVRKPLPLWRRAFARVRKEIRWQLRMMRWAKEQQAYEQQAMQINALDSRRKARGISSAMQRFTR
jgi:hypothetical protein